MGCHLYKVCMCCSLVWRCDGADASRTIWYPVSDYKVKPLDKIVTMWGNSHFTSKILHNFKQTDCFYRWSLVNFDLFMHRQDFKRKTCPLHSGEIYLISLGVEVYKYIIGRNTQSWLNLGFGCFCQNSATATSNKFSKTATQIPNKLYTDTKGRLHNYAPWLVCVCVSY